MRQIFAATALALVVACSSSDPPPSGGYGSTGSGTGAVGGGGGGPSLGSATPSPGDDGGSTRSSPSGTAVDGGTTTGTGATTDASAPPSPPPPPPPPPAAPTWTQIYDHYLASGTVGHCADCHSQAASASATYGFLSSYINGSQSTLSGIFSWMGGTMPPGGATSNAQATADVQAWIAAGALDN